MYIKDSNILLQSDSKLFSQIKNGDNGQYYKRYKDGKFYLSSKYLKDAVIDSTTNEITSIKDSINGAVMNGGGVVSPKVTKYGLKFEDSYIDFTNRYLIDNPNLLFFSEWVKFDDSKRQLFHNATLYSASTGGASRSLITLQYNRLGAGTLDVYIKTTPVGQVSSTTVIELGKYYHVAALFYNNIFWLFINGRLENTKNIDAIVTGFIYLGFNYGTNTRADDNLNLVGFMDDLYWSDTLIVNPTGKAIGEKVFEPPHRGGFNSDIKQY